MIDHSFQFDMLSSFVTLKSRNPERARAIFGFRAQTNSTTLLGVHTSSSGVFVRFARRPQAVLQCECVRTALLMLAYSDDHIYDTIDADADATLIVISCECCSRKQEENIITHVSITQIMYQRVQQSIRDQSISRSITQTDCFVNHRSIENSINELLTVLTRRSALTAYINHMQVAAANGKRKSSIQFHP
jgi:hypothetical protein